MKRIYLIAIILIFLTMSFATNLGNWQRSEQTFYRTMRLNKPMVDYKTHTVGQLYFTVSNYGFFGSKRGAEDPDCARDWETGRCRSSAEYPGGSGIEYLFQGALWLGAVIAGDTLVSVGEDGWERLHNELFPGYMETDSMILRSSFDDSTAVSEQDYIAEFTDTITNPNVVPASFRHRPLGIKIHQESYSWSYDYTRNFVFIDYLFINIREDRRTIEDMFIGIYVDGDCGHVTTPQYAQDDVTGFVENYHRKVTNEDIPIKLAWIADNDGDPEDGKFTNRSPTGAMAVRVLKAPGDFGLDSLEYSYNWWISNSNETYDWGPCSTWLGFIGTPEGDINKYKIMSNKEFDFNQTDIKEKKDDPVWAPCPVSDQVWPTLKDGYDTRFLLSFGPINIEPDETVNVVIAFLVGENFHNNPQLKTDDEKWPKFNFDNLAFTAYWTKEIYDHGYKGPSPPPPPKFKVITSNYEMVILWKGEDIEDAADPITEIKDFEGYRIYVAEENIASFYVPLVQFDRVDFLVYSKMVRFIDSVSAEGDTYWVYQGLYSDTLVDIPDEYTLDILTPDGDPTGETVDLIPEPYDYNVGMPPDTVIDSETWYYYTIKNVLPGDEKWIVVTSYDYGLPSENLGSLESNKTNAARAVAPRGADITDKKVRVVPNPYRVDRDYKEFWEYSAIGVWSEYSRKIRFFNLPSNCIIRIFTLDGDLVKKLYHDESNKDIIIGSQDWNLINKNDQSIASGIYIFSVEDKDTGELQTGRFVIIK